MKQGCILSEQPVTKPIHYYILQLGLSDVIMISKSLMQV